MLLTGTENIRDVIAFPKTQRGQCLLTDAPSEVDQKQLDELNLRTQKHLHAIEPQAQTDKEPPGNTGRIYISHRKENLI